MPSLRLAHTKLRPAELLDVDLAGARFEDVNLARGKIVNASLRQLEVTDADARKSRWTDINFSGATMIDVDLRDVKIRDANIRGLTIDGVRIDLLLAKEKRARRR